MHEESNDPVSAPPLRLLERATRGLFAVRGPRGPQVSPMTWWFDGAHVWLATSPMSVLVDALRRSPDCALYVPPAGQSEAAVVVHGRARVYDLDDPLGLALHTPMIAAAMTTLAVRATTTLRDVVGNPARWSLRNRVVVRVRVEQAREVDPPDVVAGVAPALPTVVASDVRRELAGQRHVVVVVDDGERLQATPAVWSAGYELATPPTATLPPGARAVVAVDVAGRSSGRSLGLVMHGQLGADGRLQPDRVTSWHGQAVTTAPLTAPAPGGVELPD